jgi:hypothetical protein
MDWEKWEMYWDLLWDYLKGFWEYQCDFDECCRR